MSNSDGDELTQALTTFQRSWRLALAHILLQLCSSGFWITLALCCYEGMQHIPDDWISAHSWLRGGMPIVLAMGGMLANGLKGHAGCADKVDAAKVDSSGGKP